MPWRGPRYPGELPTLGWYALDWVAENLVVPDGPRAGEPLVFTRDQAQFVLNLYTVDPGSGKRRIRRAVWSRAKGVGKSPTLAALCLLEALADVVPDGWDGDGEPVGRPWASLGFKPKAQVVAVSEDQTANTWDPLLDMARYGPVAGRYDIEAMETFVNVPRGRIEFVTSSATSREGFRPVFASMDQTESWVAGNGGHRLAAAIRRNLAKTGGCSVESPNAYRPGLDSVAERSHRAWLAQLDGRLKGDDGILVDHREAPADTDLGDRDSMLHGLAVAYGCAARRDGGCVLHGPGCDQGWQDLERLLAEAWDPDTDPADARAYYLNQVTTASDAWLSPVEWAGCSSPATVVGDGDTVVLGFDGSRSRRRGVADATALVGCRVADGHVFLLGCWQQPDGPAGDGWEVPAVEVDAVVREAFDRWDVVGFYADPARWESWVAQWEAAYGHRLRVRASRDHPVEWWMGGGRGVQTVRALAGFHDAVVDRELTHDGSSVLMQHVTNARQRPSRAGMQIGKEHPDSARKIDAAVAAVLAWQARVDALALPAPEQRPARRAGVVVGHS